MLQGTQYHPEENGSQTKKKNKITGKAFVNIAPEICVGNSNDVRERSRGDIQQIKLFHEYRCIY